jgi:hypothetical protein
MSTVRRKAGLFVVYLMVAAPLMPSFGEPYIRAEPESSTEDQCAARKARTGCPEHLDKAKEWKEQAAKARERCATEWPDDFRKRTLCEEEQIRIIPSYGTPYGRRSAEAVIQEKCDADWAHNARMRAACIEQQERILEKSRATAVDPRLKTEDLSLMQEKCAKEWPDDFRKQVQCEQKQIQGFQKLQSLPPKGVTLRDYAVAMAQCAKDWPDDFRLRARCLEEQLAAARMNHDIETK